jgi:iron-sulfur cluster assembly protein
LVTASIIDIVSEVTTQPIAVTERAAAKAISLSQREGFAEPILRLRVLAGGCSGFSYKLSFERDQLADDHVIEAYGLRVLVDPKSAPIVMGSILEFNDAMLGGGFKVNNPQAVHECACGESFSV